MNAHRRNRNRGYQQLHVWIDAIELYRMTCVVVRGWPFELKRTAGQAIAAADSVHRNIAEGYCRRSVKEYIQFLYTALGSLGESVSAYVAFKAAEQISAEQIETLDALAFKLENGLLRLVESLERKRDDGDWTDTLVIRESNATYHTSTPGSQPDQESIA